MNFPFFKRPQLYKALVAIFTLTTGNVYAVVCDGNQGVSDDTYTADQAEIDALLSSDGHPADWAFFTPGNGDNTWYIGDQQGRVLFLAPFKSNKEVWGLVGGKTGWPISAKTDFSQHTFQINSGIVNLSPSDGYLAYLDGGSSNSYVSDPQKSSQYYAQKIEGKQPKVGWYFFKTPYNNRYYIASPETQGMVLYFSKAPEGSPTNYCWKTIQPAKNWGATFGIAENGKHRIQLAEKVSVPSIIDSPGNEITVGGLQLPVAPESSGQITIDNPTINADAPVTNTAVVPTTCSKNTFSDNAEISPKYGDAAEAFCSAGILVGYVSLATNGQYIRPLKPKKEANYVEVLKVLHYANDYENTAIKCGGITTFNSSTWPQWFSCHLDTAKNKNISLTYPFDDAHAGNLMSKGDAYRYAAKLFFGYSSSDGQQAANYLLGKNVIDSGETTNLQNNILREEMIGLASKSAVITDKKIPYGVVAQPSSFTAPTQSNGLVPRTSLPEDIVVRRAISGTQVVKKAFAEVGKRGIPWVDGRYTYCARFVRVMYGQAPRWGTANQMCNHYANQGALQQVGTPPAGSVICYYSSAGNGYFGHVSIAVSSNNEVGVTSRKLGVTKNTLKTVGNFRGYIAPQDFDYYYWK